MSRRPAGRARPAAASKGRRPRQAPAGPGPAGPAPGSAPGRSGGLAAQLRALGLKLREVPGDGAGDSPDIPPWRLRASSSPGDVSPCPRGRGLSSIPGWTARAPGAEDFPLPPEAGPVLRRVWDSLAQQFYRGTITQTQPFQQQQPFKARGVSRKLRAQRPHALLVSLRSNCLFRALGDQLEGHSRNHVRHRQETVQFMLRQRGDFEPFVEDDVPFDKHVANLAKPGTFAGNDAIVAFASNHVLGSFPVFAITAKTNTLRNQTLQPIPNAHLQFVSFVEIRGTERSDARELHIAYRYGEHYDSVRRLSDDSGAPACLRVEMLCKNNSNKTEEVKPHKGNSEDETEVEMEDTVQKVCSATGCSDMDLVSHVLEVEDYNVESAIFAILQMKEGEGIGTEEQQEPLDRQQKSCSRTLWEENGTGSRIFGNQSLNQGEAENNKGQAGSREENRTSRNPKVAKKHRKEQQRLEKKKRQEERHRQKVLATKRDSADSRTDTDPASHITLVKAMAALNI
ncbi:hypothetical protein DV515_00013522 [Chloebia gouldiae]|uniref:ubiquitinyl hydrolase 1 n=1 Tax=Chloebia gouldiae TaxID=44316 RepID=A0A3L8S0X7_CHLGU|nr:hypothetical protein DV515_00013522 [Chloebia gouldiae]